MIGSAETTKQMARAKIYLVKSDKIYKAELILALPFSSLYFRVPLAEKLLFKINSFDHENRGGRGEQSNIA